MSDGWIKLHRQIEEFALYFSEPFTKTQAWIDLLILANHKPGSVFLRGVEVKVDRGQLAWSELSLAKRWRWSRNKLRRFLKWLETEQQIEQQKDNITTLLTIVNYDQYQCDDDTASDTAEGQQKDSKRYTDKNGKNNKKEKDITNVISKKKKFIKPSLSEIEPYFEERSAAPGEAQRFHDYYEANGWRVGRNPMKDWHAAARGWISRSENFKPKEKQKVYKVHGKEVSKAEFEAYKSRLNL